MNTDFLKNKKLIRIGKIIGILSFFIIPYYLPILVGSNVMGGYGIERCIISTETTNPKYDKLIKKLRSLFDSIKWSKGKEVPVNDLPQEMTEALKKITDDNDRFISVFQTSNDFIRYEILLKNRTYFSLGGIQKPGRSKKYDKNEATMARCLANGKEVEMKPNKKEVLLSRLKLKEDIQKMVSSTDSCLKEIGQSIPQNNKLVTSSTTVETVGLNGCVDLTVRPDRQSRLVTYMIFFSGWVAVLYVLKKGPIKFLLKGLGFFKD